MSSRPWMPLYINDFRLDTLDLDPAEIGCYLILLMIAWRRDDGAIPDDMKWLKRSLQACTANFHGHMFNRIIPRLLNRYFQLKDGKWYNKRLDLERQKADKFSAKQKQIADKRWSDHRQINMLAPANAMPSHSHSHKKEGNGLSEKTSSVAEKIAQPVNGRYYAKAESKQWLAWDAHLKSQGKSALRDRDGGWLFPAEWPPTVAPQ